MIDLSTAGGRWWARKKGLDVPKRKPGKPPIDLAKFVRKTAYCWLWTGYLNSYGYGRYSRGGKEIFAHREAWERATGKSAVGLVIRHRCDVPRCVNPAHLVCGTALDNRRDCVKRGRHARGSLQGTAKLTEKLAAKIRREYKPRITTMDMLAKRYGVCHDTIRKCVARIYWRHVA